MCHCLFRVTLFACKDEGGSEGGDVKTQVEDGIAVGSEGAGVGRAAPENVGSFGCSRVGPVFLGFRVEVVGSTRAAGRGDCGKWDNGLGEVAFGCVEDPIMIDGGDVGARACFGW